MQSREGKVVEPALGATLPSHHSNFLCHHGATLLGVWWVSMAGGAHPHHGPPNPSNFLAPT